MRFKIDSSCIRIKLLTSDNHMSRTDDSIFLTPLSANLNLKTPKKTTRLRNFKILKIIFKLDGNLTKKCDQMSTILKKIICLYAL